MKRVESLDYLRGIMAMSVMLYHYTSWAFGTLIGGEFLLGKLGIYAVSMFYILSGLSLTIAYQDKINQIPDVITFIVKRIFRIFPLFWLAITVAITIIFVRSVISLEFFDISSYKVFLNYSLLFGFIEPSYCIIPVSWSIGNEMVFYAIFPFILLLSSRFRYIFQIAIFLSIISGFYFSFIVMNENIPLNDQWSIFINPFNQIFLFMAGSAIGKWGKCFKQLSSHCGFFLLIIVFFLFWLYPASDDLVQIVTGIERVIFSILCIMFVLLLYVLNPKLKLFPSKALGYLGQGCYSIYLLHTLVPIPIVYVCSKYGVNKPIAYLLSFYVTVVISGLTFTYIEKPMMNIGKIISYKISLNKRSLNTTVKQGEKV